MWRCDYCGHQQHPNSRKCADCGGPRADSSYSGEIVTWSGLDDVWFRQNYHPFQDKLQEFTDCISEGMVTIGGAFKPILTSIEL